MHNFEFEEFSKKLYSSYSLFIKSLSYYLCIFTTKILRHEDSNIGEMRPVRTYIANFGITLAVIKVLSIGSKGTCLKVKCS